MSTLPLLLAAAEAEKAESFWGFLDLSTLGGVITLGAIGLVTLLVLLWAVFLRRRRRRRHSHHHAHRPSSQPTETPVALNNGDAVSPRKKRRHRRRSDRRHRPRNPTLAETGGLPPIRPEDSSELRP
jgi:hypothetical protein